MKETDAIAIIERMRKCALHALEARQMTMSELARRSMLSRHTVLNLLHKAKCGNIITWLMLADGLGMTLDELARKEEE